MKKRFLGIVSIIYSLLIFYVWFTDKLKSFLAPNMQIYLKVSSVVLLIMGLILLLNNRIKYKFKISDLVLLLPIIMVILSGDGNLSLTFAKSKMISKSNKTEERVKDDTPIEVVDDNTEYNFDEVYFDIVDYNYSYLADYLTYMKGARKFDGKTIRVRGFAIDYSEFLQDGYFALGKYAITCCAADAEFTGFAVKYDLSKIKYGSWYEIEGVLREGKDREGYTIMTLEAVNVKEIDKKNEEQYIYSCAAYGNGKCDELLKYDLEY
jgi:uncharacterized repeat protein (TIGR03943 family)